jgi:signal transduction histidine kinase
VCHLPESVAVKPTRWPNSGSVSRRLARGPLVQHPSQAASPAMPRDFPTSIGVAILRHHLYEIDVALNRSLVVRRLVYDLRPPALDELGLLGAVRQQAERLAVRGRGLDIRVDAPATLGTLGAATEVAAYRIATEAVANAIRYGHARHWTVRIATDGQLCVELTDDGDGIAAGQPLGVGLTAMQERAAEIGGKCTISESDPAGTRVLALLPLDAS